MTADACIEYVVDPWLAAHLPCNTTRRTFDVRRYKGRNAEAVVEITRIDLGYGGYEIGRKTYRICVSDRALSDDIGAQRMREALEYWLSCVRA